MEERKLDYVVTGYVFNRYDQALLVKHEKLDLWLPIGGHIEENETPDEAMKREAREEVGLDIHILGKNPVPLVGSIKKNLANPFYVNVHSVGDHDHCSFFYVCKALEHEKLTLNENEASEYLWLGRNNFFKKNDLPEDVMEIGKKAFCIAESNA